MMMMMMMSICRCRWLFPLFSAQHPSTGAGIRRPRPLPEFLLKSFPPTTPPESFTAVRDIGVSQFIWSFQPFSTYLSLIPRGAINDVKCHISPISKDHVILGLGYLSSPITVATLRRSLWNLSVKNWCCSWVWSRIVVDHRSTIMMHHTISRFHSQAGI